MCGSYALLHAANLSYKDLIPLENSTGASFGTCCAGEEYGCTRLLTVFRDFNYGIDRAAPLWGIHLKRIEGKTKEPVEEMLKDLYLDRIVIGPISMVGLIYLPLSQQFRYIDHFITCIRQGRNKWRLIDSEGIPYLSVDSEQIIRMLSIQDIPEACDKYTARAVLDVKVADTVEDKEIRIRRTLETAYVNLTQAQDMGQGYKAFLKCADIVPHIPYKKRRPFLYSIDYLVQRKIMLLILLQEGEKKHGIVVNPHMTAKINEFIETAGVLKKNLYDRDTGSQEALFHSLSEGEKCITENWREWVRYGKY